MHYWTNDLKNKTFKVKSNRAVAVYFCGVPTPNFLLHSSKVKMH